MRLPTMYKLFPPLIAALLVYGGASPSKADAVDFSRDVRPILADRCFPCHGPDADARQGELRLDTRTDATQSRDGIFAISPGNPDESEVVRRIFATDADARMPPTDSNLSLSDKEKVIIRQWIADGADWTTHWAFVAPVKPRIPQVEDSRWPRNAIDSFILSTIEHAGLKPSPEASRETLIRRVTIDLTGLMPTPDQVDAFLADTAHDAYEKVVDRLLSSKRYGERMAWEWLEAGRYADTDGFQGDPTRSMWPWRDWLITALNRNLSFDQFTIEMLAGDLLADPTDEQIIASGFNRNHMSNGEGGRIPEETRVENVFDRTETTSTVWLGLTMTCARCHDHKFDPITQHEYYQLYDFFNNTSETGRGGGGKAAPVTDYLTPQQKRSRQHIDDRMAALGACMDAPMPRVDQAQRDWERAVLQRRENRDVTQASKFGAWSILGPLPAPAGDPAATFDHPFGPEMVVDLNATFADGNHGWRALSGFADATPYTLPDTIGATYLFRTIQASGKRILRLSLGSDDGLRVWLNGSEVLANNVKRSVAADQEQLQLELQPGNNELLVKIVNVGGPAGFYFQKAGESVDGIPEQIAEIMVVDADSRTPEDSKTLQTYYRQAHSSEWQAWHKERQDLRQQRERISGVKVMVMDELPADQRRKTFTLSRGVYNKPLEEVSAGVPEILPVFPERAPRNRLTLARWIVSRNNPLTARVIINRYWQMFFGTGIVETAEDFGRQSSRPSHPKLLDWLATEFVRNGWNVKAMHRMIVTSATYRQSSRFKRTHSALTGESQSFEANMTSHEIDPRNRLLSRSPRYRMPSWMLRDQALTMGDVLVQTLGGPPVKPYQPNGIWADATFGKIRYRQDRGTALHRASIYIFWRRIVGPTMLFDAGKRQACVVRSTRTNTPLHALVTLNDTSFVEAARAMAARVMRIEGKSLGQRITHAFRLATARVPDPQERDLLMLRWRHVKELFLQDPDQARALLSTGELPLDPSLELSEQAAYTVVCSLIMNLDEALTRE